MDLKRRGLLAGAVATSAGALTVAGRSLTPEDHPTAEPLPVVSVPDRAALRVLPARFGQVVHVSEQGREGLFECVSGDFPDDPLQGLIVPSVKPGLHFARLWDGIHGRPEWFGAIVNDGHVDNAAAIEACYALCPVTLLAQADYFIQRTVVFNRSWRTVRGVGKLAIDRGQGTRIVLARFAPGVRTDDLIVVGSAIQPAGGHTRFPKENHFSNFTLIRDGLCMPHGSGDPARYPTGLRAAHLLFCSFNEIVSLESSVGFYIGGVVYTKFFDCQAQRVMPGTLSEKDLNVGYFLDGRPKIGLAGGNASLYMTRCLTAEQHPSHVDPTGLLAQGAFVDTFLDHFESARIATGIAFRVDGAREVGRTVDVHIRNPVLDGCSRFGIDVDLDATSSASVEIVDPYIYAAGAGGDRGILVHDGAGLVTLTGGQVHGTFAGGSLWFSRTRGIKVQGVKIHQSTRPVVVDQASALVLEPQINNAGMTSPAFAITCHALSRSVIRPIVIGAGAPAFYGGVSLDRTCSYVQVDGSAIDPDCFSIADPQFKVWFDNGDMRRASARPGFGASHNLLVGITD